MSQGKDTRGLTMSGVARVAMAPAGAADAVSSTTPTARRSTSNEQWLSVSLFGGFEAAHGEKPVALKSRKAKACLAYLLMSATSAEHRERVCGLLWSESDEDKARASLRQLVLGMRTAFENAGFDGFSAGRDDLRLDRSRISVDVWSVMDDAEQGRVHPLLLARQRLTDTLLPGAEDIDPAFRVWLLVQRQSYQERLVQRLERMIAEDASGAVVKEASTALIHLDPTHEGAYRRLMRHHAEAGEPAAALKLYKTLWDLLDEEYATEPSERTQDLVVRIKQGELERFATPGYETPTAPSPTGPVTPREVAPTLLVVPEFDNRGVQAELSHLSHGLRHELIAKLVRFREWSVVDDPGACNDDSRCYSLDATLRQAPSALLFVLTIKEQPSGRYVWSETFTIDLENWFQVQQEVVRRVALALNVHISAERLAATARQPDVSLSAYDRWLRAEERVLSWNPDDWAEAERIFQSIVDDAPNFAPAYSGLVSVKNTRHLSCPGICRTPERAREALVHAKAAVQADPFESHNQLTLAWSYAMSGQFDQALVNFNLAHDLNENNPWTLTSVALGLAFCGHYDEARERADQSLYFNPAPSRSQWAYQGTIRFFCGDYERSLEGLERAQNIIPNLPGLHAAGLAHLGRVGEAKRKLQEFLQLVRSNWHGNMPATNDTILEWLLDCFPIRYDRDHRRLSSGLSLAGAQVPNSALR